MPNLDEITRARKKRRNKIRIRRLFSMLTGLAIIFFAVIILNSITASTFKNFAEFFKVGFTKAGNFPYLIDGSKALKLEQIKGGFGILTESEIITITNEAGEINREAHGFVNPDIAVDGSKLLLFDRGGKEFKIYNRSYELLSSKRDNTIISADISSSGYVAMLTTSERSTSELVVLYGGDFETQFTWYGAKGFPIFCKISPNGKEVGIVCVTGSERGIKTVYTNIDMVSQSETGQIEVDGLVIDTIRFGSDTMLITEEKAILFDSKLNMKTEYLFPIAPILSIAEKSNAVGIAFGDNKQDSLNTILILNQRAEKVFLIEDMGSVFDLIFVSDKVYVLGDGRISVLHQNGELLEEYVIDKRGRSIYLTKGKLIVLLPDRIDVASRLKEETNDLADS
ncbi:MAG: hypothetical protein GX928_01940 [Ruminococcaceae bacterium]|nr:hypothetical protein [Oscillospiraceae bacterium]